MQADTDRGTTPPDANHATPPDPSRPNDTAARSGSGTPAPALVDPALVGPGQPYHALCQQAMAAVHRLDADLGRTPDGASNRLAYSAAHLAARNELDHIDHVLIGDASTAHGGVRNVFVVQGEPDNPAHRRAHMPVEAATEAPVEQTLQQLQALQAQRTATLPSPAPPAQTDPQQTPPARGFT